MCALPRGTKTEPLILYFQNVSALVFGLIEDIPWLSDFIFEKFVS